MSKQLVSSTDAVPYQEFARLIWKTPAAVKGMIEKGKLCKVCKLSKHKGA
ncbi:Regulatory phage protein cox [Klebsiella quasipneumoniae]|uniref:Regulatory phage protein cox n=1 Tax=Klebsiella pneumoniae TaxID=573 RepID=A0A486QFZ4_KLEPN|nr:Regulatory phage protein cox [Klebsiella quasipneumoniae]VGL88323.1 Regulatory phage protein cox [Klebsiella pneumoniae]